MGRTGKNVSATLYHAEEEGADTETGRWSSTGSTSRPVRGLRREWYHAKNGAERRDSGWFFRTILEQDSATITSKERGGSDEVEEGEERKR